MRRLFFMLLLGCGGGSSGTGSRAEVCADLCARFAECGSENPTCVEDCTAEELFREDLYPLLLDCAEASCANIGEGCFVMAQDDLSVLPEETAFIASCEAKETECGAPFTRDFCHAEDIRFFAADYIETDLASCLDLACTDVEACLEEKIFDSF
jgi:hypothetical protein